MDENVIIQKCKAGVSRLNKWCVVFNILAIILLALAVAGYIYDEKFLYACVVLGVLGVIMIFISNYMMMRVSRLKSKEIKEYVKMLNQAKKDFEAQAMTTPQTVAEPIMAATPVAAQNEVVPEVTNELN
ncbi:MAG: hypothetical protein LBQ95_01330 [Lachnospiraceae bacterium]|jgi:hypothetical protein|nr:hypothetical protein [Lachnospiraceae bacterium]